MSSFVIPDHSIQSFMVQAGLQFIVATSNISVICFVLSNKNIRSEKEIIITLFLCFADGIQSSISLWAAGFRMNLELRELDEGFIPNTLCLREIFPAFFLLNFQFSPFANLVFSVEKVFMIYKPFAYRRVPISHIVYMCSAVFITFLVTSVGGVFWWLSTTPVPTSKLCMGDALPISINNTMLFYRVVVLSISVLLYLPVVYKLHEITTRQNNIIGKQNNYFAELRKNASYAGILIATVLVTLIIPDTLRIAFRSLYINYQTHFVFLAVCKPLCNVLVAVISVRSILQYQRKVRSVSVGTISTVADMPTRRVTVGDY